MLMERQQKVLKRNRRNESNSKSGNDYGRPNGTRLNLDGYLYQRRIVGTQPWNAPCNPGVASRHRRLVHLCLWVLSTTDIVASPAVSNCEATTLQWEYWDRLRVVRARQLGRSLD